MLNVIHFGLYGILGIALYAVGLNALEKPIEFISILLLFMAIDVSSYLKAKL